MNPIPLKTIIPVLAYTDRLQGQNAIDILASDPQFPVLELTLRHACSWDLLTYALQKYPQHVIGAGTVLNADMACKALDLGCQFLVSPGFDLGIHAVCQKAGRLYLPGAVTPHEIQQALNLGYEFLKFFPAHIYGGLAALKAFAGPFSQVRFCPTGGVDVNNVKDFLALDNVHCVGGTWVCP